MSWMILSTHLLYMLGVYVSGCSVVLKFRKTYCWNSHSKISDYHDRLLSLTESQNQITTHQAEIVINENLYSPHNNDSSSDKINTKYTPCLQKTVHFCFCQLRQISINFNKLRSVDGKVAEIVCYIDIFHLTWSMSLHYLVEGGCSKLLPNTGFVTIRLYIFGVKVKRAYCRDNFLAQRPLPDRHALVVRRCFFLFQQDVDRPAHRAREYHRFPVATEMRETHRRLGTCVLERGAHLEHEFWQFWADLWNHIQFTVC